MNTKDTGETLKGMAERIKEMRDIKGYSISEMASLTGITEEEYAAVESAESDPSFSFLHKCALVFGVDLTALLMGHSAKLSALQVTRAGEGVVTAREQGIEIRNMAPLFRNRLATPYFVTYQYDEKLQNLPIQTSTHAGQEFDYVLSGTLKIQVGDHVEILGPGDSAFYRSSVPHGMIAVGGGKCTFVAMVMADDRDEAISMPAQPVHHRPQVAAGVASRFIDAKEDSTGKLESISFKNESRFNFAFDIVDEIAARDPEKLAMLHISDHMTERRFTFKDMSEDSNRAANYLTSLGIGKGDKVMLVLKRHFQFWPVVLACHKIGAVVIPATNQLMAHDFVYRFKAGDVKAVFCTADGITSEQIEQAEREGASAGLKIIVNGKREGWRAFDSEIHGYSSVYKRPIDAPGGDDPMLMFFTSGTTSYPKMALHSYKYALGHYVTAKYWHLAERDGLHFTISETGWGKALWGKLYGQWLCEAAIFTYDFSRFDAEKILPMFAKYSITTFCAPPTMYRMLIKEDLSKYDLTTIRHATTAGESLNPEVVVQFERATGLKIYEGFGQTETTLSLGNLLGDEPRSGSMGKPVPSYGVDLVDEDGNSVPPGEHGEIVIRAKREKPQPGIFLGYYKDPERTDEVWRGGMYHTGDLAWKDEDGYYHYVGRADDVIKSSGYRIGPAEIENVIMELPYVLECGVSAAMDPVRGQVVKATIKLVKDVQGTEELKKDVQDYVKAHTAPYKYPRIVVFADELPKTISGKIQRNKL
ncbi:MAG: AMP-binding protein [Kiritimatiellae bacterium]|nr:AMP-binding protein [Kiritimatiellia bacterium]